jgi:hypothetical protein
MTAGLRLVDEDGTSYEIARLREQNRTLNKALEATQQELATERKAAQVFHQKWEASEARFITHREKQITDARVELVWELWMLIRRGPPSSTPSKARGRSPILSEDRKKLIHARLKEGYLIEDFWMAFYGAERNLWQNKSGKWMDGIEWICRTGSNLEEYRELFCWDLAPGAGGLKVYADRQWARIEALKKPRKVGTVLCERCAAEVPREEQTGLCSACVEALKAVAA